MSPALISELLHAGEPLKFAGPHRLLPNTLGGARGCPRLVRCVRIGAIDPVVSAIEGLDASARVGHSSTCSLRHVDGS